jgi:hypothetical protein
MTLPLNLCTGNKKNAKCLNAKLEVAWVALEPAQIGRFSVTLLYDAENREASNLIQIKYVVECPHYTNQTLTEATPK